MVYFIILPGILVAIVVQLIVLGATFLVAHLRPARAYLWQALVWSTAGFVAANVIVIALGAIPLLLAWLVKSTAQEGLRWLQTAFVVAGVGVLFVGPIVGSAIGFGGGYCWGLARAARAKRSNTPLNPTGAQNAPAG